MDRRGNSDLFNLWADLQIPAKWPTENTATQTIPRGQYIGLMQVPTTDPDAWDWTVNSQDGVTLFSGGSPMATDKVQDAVRYENYLIYGATGYPARVNSDGTQLRALHAEERENMALVLYGGYLYYCGTTTCIAGSLYYIPVCPPPGKIKSLGNDWNGNQWICTGADWYWAVNDPLVDPNVQARYICPKGTSCTFGQHAGILYVSNNSQDLNYDPNKEPGVRDLVQTGGCQ